jgi:heptosyltransferase-2
VTLPGFSLQRPVVVRSPNWLGDAVMALPAVRNLKTLLGPDPLVVAAPDKLAALWEACPFVDRVISLTEPRKLWVTSRQLRPGGFGSAVLLPNSLRAGAEALLARIPQRIGYARGGRQALLSQALPVPARNPLRLHQRFYYMDLVATLGAPEDDSVPELKLEARPPDPETRPGLAICPGAEYGPAKRWPVERFVEVARHFMDRHQMRVLLLGAAGDAPVAAEFGVQVPEAENRVGKTSLGEFMRALAGARLVLCNDSGAMHVASVLGVPTVAIFGSTEPLLTGPLGRRTRVVRHHVPCSPCFLRECPIDFGCMRGVTVEGVVAVAEGLLREGA